MLVHATFDNRSVENHMLLHVCCSPITIFPTFHKDELVTTATYIVVVCLQVINSHTLGQRKNCNLPGVHVDLPVLAPNDILDVQKFACKNSMDFIAASFVQVSCKG